MWGYEVVSEENEDYGELGRKGFFKIDVGEGDFLNIC